MCDLFSNNFANLRKMRTKKHIFPDILVIIGFFAIFVVSKPITSKTHNYGKFF